MTEGVYKILTELSNRRFLPQALGLRVQIILLGFQKQSNTQIAEQLAVERHAVGRWRKRRSQSVEALVAIEVRESHAALKRAVMEVLRDAHRSGSPGKFSAQQIAEVISTACEAPRQTGRPIDTWTARELADEAVQRGIVSAISPGASTTFSASSISNRTAASTGALPPRKITRSFNFRRRTFVKST